MGKLDLLLADPLVATSDYSDESLPADLQPLLGRIRCQLGMDVVFVSKFVDGRREFVAVDAGPGRDVIRPGMSDPLEQSWCHAVVRGRLPELIRDAKPFVASGAAPHTPLSIGTHLSVPVPASDGSPWGTLCAFAFHVDGGVTEDDVERLRMIAGLLSERIARSKG